MILPLSVCYTTGLLHSHSGGGHHAGQGVRTFCGEKSHFRHGSWHAGTRPGADQLDAWFAQTAQKQYTRTLLFSTVYDLLSQVVFRIKPSVRAAYREREDEVGASLISVYNKLNGVETRTSAELVRYSASALTPLIEQLDGARVSWLPGSRVKIIDGNCLEASDRRLKVLREVQGGPLPGKSLVVYEPTHGLVCDVLPCEDGHAQERSLFGALRETIQPRDLWIADRNFCTCALLCDLDRRGACFIIRQLRDSLLRS